MKQNFRQVKCYLCGSSDIRIRPGRVRDNDDLEPLECTVCGLVFLSDFSHIDAHFYENSGMHGIVPCDQAITQRVNDEDAVRRFHDFYTLFSGKSLLDFGCGNGDFLALARTKAASVMGLEPDRQWRDTYETLGIPVVQTIADLPPERRFDVITMFHVLEHIPDPLRVLSNILILFNKDSEGGGRLLVEVPNANDALLTLYENKAFSEFTYWSCHLYLYTPDSLEALMRKAGLRTMEIRQYQRYPLANHLFWLAHGKPGGQEMWRLLKDDVLNMAYAGVLAKRNMCDTIIGIFSVE